MLRARRSAASAWRIREFSWQQEKELKTGCGKILQYALRRLGPTGEFALAPLRCLPTFLITTQDLRPFDTLRAGPSRTDGWATPRDKDVVHMVSKQNIPLGQERPPLHVALGALTLAGSGSLNLWRPSPFHHS